MGTDLRTAAQQALEALEKVKHGQWEEDSREGRALITALRAALEQPERAQAMRDAGYTRRPTLREMAEPEQPEQEPVAWMGTSGVGETIVCKKRIFSFMSTPLYTHPKRRSWQGLTQGEHEKARHVCRHVGVEGLVLWLEDKLKERNA